MSKQPVVPTTKRQKEVWDYIRRFILVNQYHPTGEQIARGVGGISEQAVRKRIEGLSKRGWVETPQGKARGVVLLHTGEASIINASKRIPADKPLVHDDRLLDRVPWTVVQMYSPVEPDVFLKLSDPSAAGAGPHDLVAVALVEDERPRAGALVIVREGDHVLCRRLDAAHETARIEGVVVGTLAIRPIQA